MGRPTYDDSSWPLVRVITPADGASDEEFRLHLERITRYHERAEREGVRLAILVDVRDAPVMPVGQRREMGHKMGSLYQRYPERLAGMAMVVESPLQRGVITAVTWFFTPPYPFKTFLEPGKAEAWLQGQLEGADRAPTPL